MNFFPMVPISSDGGLQHSGVGEWRWEYWVCVLLGSGVVGERLGV